MKTSIRHLTAILCLIAGLLIAPTATESSTQEADEVTVDGPILPPAEEGLRLNFRGVPLDTVLDYLSSAAGFVVIREATVDGVVDVLSHQPLDKDEAVALLDTILKEKGLAAIRNGRTLKIVKRSEARVYDLPVRTGNNPEAIPKTDEMVTQIIPVGYVDVTQLIQNLAPLLPSYATLSANEASNAVILTDTQANIRRMAEIIRALDTSISEISRLKVVPVRFADAEALAEIVNKTFESRIDTGQSSRDESNQRRDFFSRMRDGGQASNSSSAQAGVSAARQAQSRVVAVADTRSNSIILNAPESLMPVVLDLIEQLDSMSENAAEMSVFPLRYANASDIADVINNLFEGRDSDGGMAAVQTSFFRGRSLQPAQAVSSAEGGGRSRVLAVAEEQTNTVVVSAPKETMTTIRNMIEAVDTMTEDPTELRIFTLRNANAEETAETINQLFEQQTGTSNSDGPQAFGSGASVRFASASGGDGSSRRSERTVQESTVTVVPDTRTNSIIVRAASEVMEQVELMVERIDANAAKKKRVYVYSPQNANVESLLPILQSLFGDENATIRSTTNSNTNTDTGNDSRSRTGSSGFGRTRSGSGSSLGATSFGSVR